MSYSIQDARIEVKSMMEKAEETHDPDLAWHLSELLFESDEELAYEWRKNARKFQWEIDRYDSDNQN